jgi:condensation domain-containing protein
MSRNNIEAIYGLSPLQQGLLFHSVFDANPGAYFDQLSCTLQGNVDIEALAKAWQRVIERHAVLRTAFVWKQQEKSLQVVLQRIKLPLDHLDWRGFSADEQESRLNTFLKTDRECGFDVSKAPLMRLSLIQMAADTCELVWSFHHLIMDGWSRALLVKEVFTFYEGFCRSEEIEMEAVRPYGDYMQWLQRQDIWKAEQYWRNQLEGVKEPTRLRIEKRGAKDAKQGRQEQEVKLSEEATAELVKVSRKQQVTMNTIIQGAWAVVLSRYSGREEVVYGTTVSGRPAEMKGVERMVGLFINTLPVRVRVEGEEDVGEWLRRIQRQQVEMREYEYSPLVEIQKWSGLPPGTPLIETMVTFQNYPKHNARGEQSGTLRIARVRGIEDSNYPLTLVSGLGPGLWLQVFYDPRHFESTKIARLSKQLEVLLNVLSTGKFRKVAELRDLLGGVDIQQEKIEESNLKQARLMKFKSMSRKPISQPL